MPYIGNNHIAGDHTNNFKVLDDISSYTATFDGSASSVVDTTNNTIRVVEHRFIQGQRVTYTNGSGGNIGGLTNGTAYFVIFDTASTFKLATSASNAANSVAINLSSVGTGSSHTLNAAFDGVNTKFKITYNGGTGARFNNATQLNIAINNVLQKPNQSVSYTEGFIIEDNHKIAFKTAPTSEDIFWGSIIANTLTTFDISDHKIDTFTGDGSTTEFTLSHTPANNESLMVTINGVLQHPSNASTTRSYTLIASIIQFTAAPGVGDEIQVRHLGFAGATTADVSGFYGRTGNVVLTSNDHITTGNINAGIVTATSFDGTFSSSVGGSNANFTGIVTAGTFKGGNIDAVDGAFSGNVTIGGTLTYEDVTNIDSVGLITARNGAKIQTGTATTALVVEGDARVTGILTVGTGSITLNQTANTINVGTALTLGHTQGLQFHTQNLHSEGFEINNINASGIGTFADINVKNPSDTRITSIAPGALILSRNTPVIYLKDNLSDTFDASIELQSNELRFRGGGNNATSIRMQTTSSGVSFPQDIDVDGHTNLDNVSIAGVTTFAGNIGGTATFNDIDVDGHTNLDNINVSGVTTFAQKINLSDNFIRNCRGFNSGNEQARIVVKAGNNSASGGLRIVEYYNDDTTLFSSEIANFYTNGIELKEDVSITGITTISNKTQVNSLGVGIIPDDNMHLHISSANPRILIKSTGTNSAKIFFGDSSSNDPGVIEYDHTNNRMRFGTNNTEDRFIIESDGKMQTHTSGQVSADFTTSHSAGAYHKYELGANGGAIGYIGASSQLVTGTPVSSFGIRGESNIIFGIGNSEKVRITSDGNLGVGVSPEANSLLHVKRAAGAKITIESNDSNQSWINFSGASNEMAVGFDKPNNRFVIANHDTITSGQRVIVTTGGNIAIGGAFTPSRHVHIKDSGIIKLENTSTGGWLGLQFLGSSGTNNYDAYMGLQDSDGLFFIDNNSNGIDFAIKQNGYVGISEQNPQRPFHVTGNASYGAAHFGVFGTNAGNAYIGNTPVVTISTDGGANAGTNDDKAIFQVGRGGGGAGAAAVTTEHLRVNLGGTVQIGGAVVSNSHIDIQNTKLTIKQSANSREDGLYIERSGEGRGWLQYVGGAGGVNDGFCLSTNQLGSKTDVLAFDRDGRMYFLNPNSVGAWFGALTSPTSDTATVNIVSTSSKEASIGLSRSNSLGGTTGGWRISIHDDSEIAITEHNSGAQPLRVRNRITRAQYGIDTQSNNGTLYTPGRTGFHGTQWMTCGAMFPFFYLGERVSGSSSNYSADVLDLYASGHWNGYPKAVIIAHERYYKNGFAVWTFGPYINGSYTLEQVEGWGGYSGAHGNDRNGTVSITHHGSVNTHSGQPIHRYTVTIANSGTYSYTRWYIGFIHTSRGVYMSDTSVADVTSSTSSGGCCHMRDVTQAAAGDFNYLS